MNKIDFEKFAYYPALRTRRAELLGLDMLEENIKGKVIPLITLGKWPRSDDIGDSAKKIGEIMGGRPFFIDMTDNDTHHADNSKTLLKPDSAFKNWRDFVHAQTNAIPIVQFHDGNRREIVQQALKLESTFGRIGFRIRDFQRDPQLTIAALSALDRVENALVFIDAQYIRSAYPAYVAAVTTTINMLRSEVPETVIATLSTSFPSTRSPFMDSKRECGSIDIQDRDLNEMIGGKAVAMYGDHGSIHSVVYDAQPMRWSPTIDYATDRTWHFERRINSDSAAGYKSAAQELISKFPEISKSSVWGDKMITEAASGSPHGKSPQGWIAVRVNCHLTRQINFSYNESGDGTDDDDEL